MGWLKSRASGRCSRGAGHTTPTMGWLKRHPQSLHGGWPHNATIGPVQTLHWRELGGRCTLLQDVQRNFLSQTEHPWGSPPRHPEVRYLESGGSCRLIAALSITPGAHSSLRAGLLQRFERRVFPFYVCGQTLKFRNSHWRKPRVPVPVILLNTARCTSIPSPSSHSSASRGASEGSKKGIGVVKLAAGSGHYFDAQAALRPWAHSLSTVGKGLPSGGGTRERSAAREVEIVFPDHRPLPLLSLSHPFKHLVVLSMVVFEGGPPCLRAVDLASNVPACFPTAVLF